jgi:hypothetical protein
MTTADREAAGAALRAAQAAVTNAKWRLYQERALARLAREDGLACAPLFPEHPVIQIVACDGRLLGRVRRHRPAGRRRGARWIATGPDAHRVGAYRTLRAAARALARAAGLGPRHRVHRLPRGG